jgi:hypothetical protein
MTAKQYTVLIEDHLGLNHIQAAHWLGITMRTEYAYKNGRARVSHHVARLLLLIDHFKHTPEQASKIWGEE